MEFEAVLNIRGITISDDLRVGIGGETVQLRPAQGLRVVEKLLRASTRLMMEEAADEAGRPATRRAAPKPTTKR